MSIRPTRRAIVRTLGASVVPLAGCTDDPLPPCKEGNAHWFSTREVHVEPEEWGVVGVADEEGEGQPRDVEADRANVPKLQRATVPGVRVGYDAEVGDANDYRGSRRKPTTLVVG